MCLAFRKSNPLQRLVATEDITIYKVVKVKYDSYLTALREVAIDIGIVYKSHLGTPMHGGSYSSFVDAKILNDVDYGDTLFISHGLHAFTENCMETGLLKTYEEGLSTCGCKSVILKGRVPVGSEYYINEETGMIVASNMIYDEEIILSDYLFPPPYLIKRRHLIYQEKKEFYMTLYEKWSSREWVNFGSFQTTILQAYQIADSGNKERLELAFPEWFVLKF